MKNISFNKREIFTKVKRNVFRHFGKTCHQVFVVRAGCKLQN